MTGDVDDAGWIIDTAEIDTIYAGVHKQLDHTYLNEIDGLENPTTENLVVWCWHQFSTALKGVGNIKSIACTIRESPRSTAYYDGP